MERGKERAAPTRIPIDPSLVGSLRAHRRVQNPERLAAGAKWEDLTPNVLAAFQWSASNVYNPTVMNWTQTGTGPLVDVYMYDNDWGDNDAIGWHRCPPFMVNLLLEGNAGLVAVAIARKATVLRLSATARCWRGRGVAADGIL